MRLQLEYYEGISNVLLVYNEGTISVQWGYYYRNIKKL